MGDADAGLGAGRSPALEPVDGVVEHRAPGQQPRPLEDVGAAPRGDLHRARRGREQPPEDLQQGRLSTAAGPHDAEQLPRRHRQVEALEDLQVPEAHRQRLGADHHSKAPGRQNSSRRSRWWITAVQESVHTATRTRHTKKGSIWKLAMVTTIR